MALTEHLGGMTLGECMARTANDELYLWLARAQRRATTEGGAQARRGGR